jgi:hypothetical protein
MLKLLLFVGGLAAGAAGTASWLLSEPDSAGAPSPGTDGESLQARLEVLKSRLREAQQEGARAGQNTEEQLRHKLDAYRKGASSSAP